MLLLRHAVERLILGLLWVARSLFILQGVAFGCASLAVFLAAPPEPPAWLRSAMISAVLVSATFFGAGFLMGERPWRASHESGSEPAWQWRHLLGLSLVMFPAVATIAASPLPPLWTTIAAQLTAIEFWDGVTRNDPYAGIVILPILLALSVPGLVSAAAFMSIAFPLTMLPLLAARSRLFATLLARGTICQAALVLTSWIAVDAFARLAAQAMTAMAASGDAEVLRVSEQLDHATGILKGTALALVPPVLGMLAWLAFLRPSGAAAAAFTTEPNPGPAEVLHVTATESAAPLPQIPIARIEEIEQTEASPDRNRNAETPHSQSGSGARLAQQVLVALGALMLAFGAADRLRTRAYYESSQPVPGAILAGSPTSVRVTFGAALDPASVVSVTQLAVEPFTGQGPRDIEIARRLAPDDRERRTIEAVPSTLSAGLYRVTWQALPAGGGVPRHGSFSFGVGTPVPADTAAMTHSLNDRDAGARGRRQTAIGGVLLLVLGGLLPRLSSRLA